jgi:hypothetical protein
MRPRSITGPLILVLIGVIFLLINLGHDIPIWRWVSDYWPFLLIGLGVIRLAEVLFQFSHGAPVAPSGGGWVFWTIVLCVIMAVWSAGRNGIHIGRINTPGTVGFLGNSYEYGIDAGSPAAGITRIILDDIDGSIAIHGDTGSNVKVTGRKTVRAFSRGDADRANAETAVRVDREGDSLVVRARDPLHSGMLSIAADLDIVAPKGINIESRGRGDLNVEDVDGSVSVTGARGDVRLNDIGKDVRVESARGGLIRAVAVKGAVDLEGRGGDIQLENVAGQVTINGEFSGSLEFRNLTRPMHFQSSRSDLRVEQVPGSIVMDLGQMKVTSAVGPLRFRTPSRDIEVQDVSNSLELNVDHGDIQIAPSKSPLPKMDIHSRSGEITLTLPDKASFELDGRTGGGEVENDFGDSLETHNDGRSASIKGKVGNGPQLVLSTDRGNLTIHKR